MSSLLPIPIRLASLEPNGDPFDFIASGRQDLPFAYARLSRPGCAGFFPTQLASLELSGGPIYLIASGQMNCPAHTPPPGGVPAVPGPGDGARTPFTHRRIPSGPAPFPTANASLACGGGPFHLILARRDELAGSGGGTGRRPGFAGSQDGASHRVLRHPREASLTPQAPTPSREWIQRYSRRAAQGACRRPRGIGYVLGVFWYFLSLVTKSTTFPPAPSCTAATAHTNGTGQRRH